MATNLTLDTINLHDGTTYELSMNDATGQRYTPLAPTPITLATGGPPFTPGRYPVWMQYDNVVESFGVQVRGASRDTIVANVRAIRQPLAACRWKPQLLQWTPNGHTDTLRGAVMSGSLQELPAFLNEEDGRGMARCVITWERWPFWYSPTSETIVNAVTYTNTGGSGGNVEDLPATLKGDYGGHGQPMNVFFSGGDVAVAAALRMYVATTSNPGFLNRNDSLITSSTSWADAGSASTLATGEPDLPYRLLMRVASPDADLALRCIVRIGSASGPIIWTTGAWRPGASTAAYYDFGFFRIPPQFDRASYDQDLYITPQFRSHSGSATTGTLDFLECPRYYTFARIDTRVTPGSNQVLVIESFPDSFGVTGLPHQQPFAFMTDSTKILQNCTVRGTLPLAISGGDLWCAWTSGGVHDVADSITVSATSLPLYAAMRGNE